MHELNDNTTARTKHPATQIRIDKGAELALAKVCSLSAQRSKNECASQIIRSYAQIIQALSRRGRLYVEQPDGRCTEVVLTVQELDLEARV